MRVMVRRTWSMYIARLTASMMAISPGLLWGPAAAQPKDKPAIHNMLIVGQQNLYLSHLPMFQESGQPLMPHRFQVILEVAFTKQEAYAKDRQAHPATIYMLNPQQFI